MLNMMNNDRASYIDRIDHHYKWFTLLYYFLFFIINFKDLFYYDLRWNLTMRKTWKKKRKCSMWFKYIKFSDHAIVGSKYVDSRKPKISARYSWNNWIFHKHTHTHTLKMYLDSWRMCNVHASVVSGHYVEIVDVHLTPPPIHKMMEKHSQFLFFFELHISKRKCLDSVNTHYMCISSSMRKCLSIFLQLHILCCI